MPATSAVRRNPFEDVSLESGTYVPRGSQGRGSEESDGSYSPPDSPMPEYRRLTRATRGKQNRYKHELPPKQNQALRLTEDVDIKSDGAGGYYVGWTDASEYLRYMVEVTEDGEREGKGVHLACLQIRSWFGVGAIASIQTLFSVQCTVVPVAFVTPERRMARTVWLTRVRFRFTNETVYFERTTLFLRSENCLMMGAES